jgi:hypothetical protein
MQLQAALQRASENKARSDKDRRELEQLQGSVRNVHVDVANVKAAAMQAVAAAKASEEEAVVLRMHLTEQEKACEGLAEQLSKAQAWGQQLASEVDRLSAELAATQVRADPPPSSLRSLLSMPSLLALLPSLPAPLRLPAFLPACPSSQASCVAL